MAAPRVDRPGCAASRSHRRDGVVARPGRKTALRLVLSALLAAGLGLGVTAAVAIGSRPVGAATGIVYTYQVRGLQNRSSLAGFAAEAAQTYADPRGWSLGGSIRFRQVSSGGQFTLWLAAAGTVPGFGSPCDSSYSCTVGRNVIINETRWLGGTAMWTAFHGSLRDYQHMVVNHETGHWLGFGHAFCAGPGQLAPVMQQQSISLQGCRPNPWPLPGERARLAASRGVAIVTGFPIGSLDSVTAGLASVRVRGWMIDPDTAAAGRVTVYLDGGAVSVPANGTRTDIAAAHRGYGAWHGFDRSFTVAPGRHLVCAYALNVAGPGGTSALGCAAVTVAANPVGHLDSVRPIAHAVLISGWTIDPDTVAPNRAAGYVDSGGVRTAAGSSRPDVARAYPHFGPRHGFSVIVPAAPGRHRVCAYGINTAGGGANVRLGCLVITLPS